MSLIRKSHPRNDLTSKKFGMLTPIERIRGGIMISTICQITKYQITKMNLQRLSPMPYGRGSRVAIDTQQGFRKRIP